MYFGPGPHIPSGAGENNELLMNSKHKIPYQIESPMGMLKAKPSQNVCIHRFHK